MPYHTTQPAKAAVEPKKIIKIKEPPITGLSDKVSNRLRNHAKEHKGGMKSNHIKIMLKHLRNKISFKKAHEMALKENKDKENPK